MKKLTAEQKIWRAEQVLPLRKKGLSLNEIASRLEISRDNVTKICKKHGL